MDFKSMTIEEFEARRAEICAELDSPEADLDALEAEARAIKQELDTRRAAESKKAEIRAAVAAGQGEVKEKILEEKKSMPILKEIRNSEEYINAFANYIKTNDDSECRALLSTNVEGGVVPVPEYIEGRIRTAWENDEIMNLVRKTFVRGNLKIGFEVSATPAEVHTEGSGPIEPEELVLGTVTLIPESIKKLIQVSDEALDLAGREFLDYLYDELTYQITRKAASVLMSKIADAPETASAAGVGVPVVEAESLTTAAIIEAEGKLNAEATNPVIVTTRSAAAALKVAALSGHFAIDPFDGMRVVYVPEADLGGAFGYVADFGLGAHANYPNGAEITIKYDDRTDMRSDLVNILGRQYVAFGLVADAAFVKIAAAQG